MPVQNKPELEATKAVTTEATAGSQLQAISVNDFAGVKINRVVLRQVLLSYQANQRRGLANTKTRGQIRGGGRKPWRQKGTGRARTGSIRNPIWRGGGIIFGPTAKRNHTQKITTQFRRQSLAAALHIQAKVNRLKIVQMAAPVRTAKDAKATYPEILISRQVLLIVPDASFGQGFKNFANINVISGALANALDILSAHNVIFVNDTYKRLMARLKVQSAK